MAEICSGGGDGGGGVLVRGTEPSAASAVVYDASTRAARRRRMQIRRLRLADGAVAPPEVSGRKRQQLDCLDGGASHKALRRDDGNGGDDEEKVESGSIAKQELPLLQVIESGSADHCNGYGMTSIRGRRRDMEDAVSICPDFLRGGRQDVDRCHFFGVYDGHGCSHVATSCKDRMHEIVAEEIGSEQRPELKEVLERSFLRMDGEVETPRRSADGAAPSCRCELQTPMCNHVGSTAVVAVVSSDRIVVSNCGDSRAVLCRGGGAVPLSTDHKPDRPDELQRIQAAGGRVIYWDGARVLGVLAMSRAIGDGYLKPFVSSEPEVTVTERREEDECLILASDGLWDVVTNEMACYIARMCLRGSSDGRRSDKACSDAAMLLTKLALARHSADSVSAVVVDLRRRS